MKVANVYKDVRSSGDVDDDGGDYCRHGTCVTINSFFSFGIFVFFILLFGYCCVEEKNGTKT